MTEKIQAIVLHVDGMKFGPFYNLTDEKINRLKHKKGVEFEYILIDKPVTVRKPKVKKPQNLSLLGMDSNWVPRRKGW